MDYAICIAKTCRTPRLEHRKTYYMDWELNEDVALIDLCFSCILNQGSNGCFMTNLKVAYTWNFFDGIISTGSLDHKTKECDFVPLGHFPEMGQIHNGGSRFELP